MIRTLIALTAFAALAGATEMKVSLVGKDETTISKDLDKAAK